MEPRGRGRGRGRGRRSPSTPPAVHIDLSVKIVVEHEESGRGSGSKEKNSSSDSDCVYEESGRGSGSKEKNSSPDSDCVGTGVRKLNIGDDKPAGFDICPPKQAGTIVLKPPLLVKNREKRRWSSSSNELLRPGMVLLKGYLGLSDQEKIVKRCRELGVGGGGFYQPGYGEETKMHLKMMCLGKNWDPESSQYGEQRPFDGAKPPQIPAEFLNLVHNALQEANALQDAKALLPSISPDICIVNFYSQTGRLGLHQDKDESQDSLRRGLPVVSFSIGDSADFLYSDHRDPDLAQKLVLDSGDVLIFGGPSRNIFHGVTAIHPNTAPNLLLQQTNLRPGRLNLTFRQY